MTSEEKAFCESWVKAHAHKWQVLNRAQWKYQFRGKAMVRYVDEVQMRENEVRLLLEYLSSDDCVATLSTYDQSLGSEWKPIKAWYEIANKSVGAVHGVRLYHGLRTDVVDGEDGPYVIEDGCAYKVSITYHWDEATAPEVPASTSGVSYRIGGISRDPDTGFYTYSIETRERVQQDIAKYLTSETAFVKTYEETHFGVRQNEVPTTGEQAGVSDGRLVSRRVSKNSDCTSDVHNTTHDAKPWIQRYDWWSGDTHHYVVKYGNQPNEFANVVVPADADSVHKGDSINAFNLHDGQIVWSYGPWRTTIGDLKFVKHGRQQKFYMSYTKKHDRKRYHRVKTIQTVFIRGDAYTDFLSRLIEADANSTQNGVLAVKLLEKYQDKDGNLLAEWVELRGSLGAEDVCTSRCEHGPIDEDATKNAIDLIIKNFEASSMTKTSKDTTAESLRGLEDAMIARDSRRDYINENTGNDISGGMYAFRKSQGWSDGLGFEKAVVK